MTWMGSMAVAVNLFMVVFSGGKIEEKMNEPDKKVKCRHTSLHGDLDSDKKIIDNLGQ